MSEKRKIKAILFDLGNTLMYFKGDWSEVMDRADRQLLADLQKRGFALEEASFLKRFRARLNEYFDQREIDFIESTSANILGLVLEEFGNPDLNSKLLESALESMYAISQQHWIIEDDAISTLERLKSAGYPIGYVSNASNDADVQKLVDRGNLRQFADFVLSSATCGIRKPDARIFEIALANWEFPAEEVAMVGDTLGADILGAQNAGLYGIWIPRRAENPNIRDSEVSIQPDAQIASLSELLPLLNPLK